MAVVAMKVDDGPAFEAILPPEVLEAIPVITSYSIHYTKLYEVMFMVHMSMFHVTFFHIRMMFQNSRLLFAMILLCLLILSIDR